MSEPANVVLLKYEYWIRISVVVKVCLKEALLEILHDPLIVGLTKNKQQLHALLTNFKTREERNLKGVIKPFQWDKLCHTCTGSCPVPCSRNGKTDSENLDITCVILLIIHLTKLPAPLGRKGWKQSTPQRGDVTKAAYVLIARQLRNDLIHCSLLNLCTQQQFDDCWCRIEDILRGLVYKNMALFNQMRTSSLDPYMDQKVDCLKDKYLALNLQTCDQQTDLDALKEACRKVQKEVECTAKKSRHLSQHLEILLHIQQTTTKTMRNMEGKLNKNSQEISALWIRLDSCNDNVEKIDYQTLSEHLKTQTKRQYGRVKVELSPKSSSLCCDGVVERDDIIVDLSLINDVDTVLSLASHTSDMQQIVDLREKQKESAHKTVDYQDIVTSDDDYVIISGVPGCGKTTLVETILHQWASNRLWNSSPINFNFVFVLYFRRLSRFKISPHITAEKILSFYYPEYTHIFTSKNTKSLLILEGFDELSGKEFLRLREEEFTSFNQAIYDLLDPTNGRLPLTRIITSRPGSCSILLETGFARYCKQRVFEITGFSDDNIRLYIQKHFPTELEAQRTFKNLKDTPIVYDMMVVPFYCWGVCYLLRNEVTVEEFGQTYTALFASLLALFIRNHGLRNPNLKLNNILFNPKFKQICTGLADLAFQLEEQGKISFTQEDLPNGCQMEELIRNSGMIIEIENDGFSDGQPTTFQFLHYTFHEFLVALHMLISKRTFIVSENTQILSMLAGLLGGSLDPSVSSTIVQRLSRRFSVPNTTNFSDLMKAQYNVISTTELYSLIYEFQNPVQIAHEFVLVDNLCYSPYMTMCQNFLEALRNEHQVKLGTVKLNFLNIRTNVGLFETLLSCCNVNELMIRGCSTLVSAISKKNFQFERIVLWQGTDSITSLLHHAKVLEICGIFTKEHDIVPKEVTILRLLATQQNATRKTRKVVLHLNINDISLSIKELIDCLDVCEEFVLGFRHNRGHLPLHDHRHSKNCVSPEVRDFVFEAQRISSERLEVRNFKILKSIKIGASCIKGLLYSPSILEFS